MAQEHVPCKKILQYFVNTVGLVIVADRKKTSVLVCWGCLYTSWFQSFLLQQSPGWFNILVLAHPACPGNWLLQWVCVCVCVSIYPRSLLLVACFICVCSVAAVNVQSVLVLTECDVNVVMRLDRRASADCWRQCRRQSGCSYGTEGGRRENQEAWWYLVCLRLSANTLHSLAITHPCSDGSTSTNWYPLLNPPWWEYAVFVLCSVDFTYACCLARSSLSCDNKFTVHTKFPPKWVAPGSSHSRASVTHSYMACRWDGCMDSLCGLKLTGLYVSSASHWNERTKPKLRLEPF